MAERLSMADRMVFSAIGAGFGAVAGTVLCYSAVFAFTLAQAPIHIIPFSAFFFALVGFIMGAFLGDFVAAVIAGLLDLFALVSSADRGTFTNRNTFRPYWIGLLFLVWLGASWLMYLRT